MTKCPGRNNGNGKSPLLSRNGVPRKTTVITTGALIPQEHGGALRNGGTNKGGPGRPPSEIRKRLRGSFDERIPILEKIADGKQVSASDKARVMELMGKFGLGTEVTVTFTGFPDVQRGFDTVERVIRQNVSSAVADSIIEQITDELRKG